MKTLYLLLMISFPLHAVGQVLISGRVLDEDNIPVTGANVFLKDTYDGTSTDVNGYFSFTTEEEGSQHLIVRFLGYEEFTLLLDASSDKENISVVLKESVSRINAVVITAGSFTAGEEASREVLKPLDIVTTAGATADIAGALNTLPGTQTVGETGRLFVRGGGGDETKTFIDGNQVLHAYSSSAPNTPGRGRFSPFMFSGTSFSTGGYSAEYGQALSSALVLKTRDAPVQTRTDLSLISVGGGLSHTQKFRNDGALIAGIDYKNLAPYFHLVKQKISWDKAPSILQGNVIYRKKLSDQDLFKIYSNVSTSHFNIDQNPGNPTEGYVDIANDYYYGNSTYRKIFNEKWSLSSGISYTWFNENITIDQNLYNKKEYGAHIKSVASLEVSSKISLIGGLEHFVRNYSLNYNEDLSGEAAYNQNLTSLFLEGDFYSSNEFVTRIGVRSEYNALQDKYYFVPRISLAYKIDKSSQISFAYGNFNQTGDNEFVSVRNDLRDEKASHYIFNYQREVNDKTFRIEGYYKKYRDLIKFNSLDRYNPSGYNNSGNGFARGFDIFWRDSKTIKGLDYWLSYSFLDTKRNYRDFPQAAIPHFASKHNFSVVGKYFIESLKTQVGATYSFVSPRPYHDPNHSGFNNQRTKAYNDLSMNLSYLLGPAIIIHASVTNVLGFKNVFGYEVSEEQRQDGLWILKPITPPAPRFIFLGVFITFSREKTLNQLPNL